MYTFLWKELSTSSYTSTVSFQAPTYWLIWGNRCSRKTLWSTSEPSRLLIPHRSTSRNGKSFYFWNHIISDLSTEFLQSQFEAQTSFLEGYCRCKTGQEEDESHVLGDGRQWLVEMISIGGSTEVGTAAAPAADHCRRCRERGPCASGKVAGTLLRPRSTAHCINPSFWTRHYPACWRQLMLALFHFKCLVVFAIFSMLRRRKQKNGSTWTWYRHGWGAWRGRCPWQGRFWWINTADTTHPPRFSQSSGFRDCRYLEQDNSWLLYQIENCYQM